MDGDPGGGARHAAGLLLAVLIVAWGAGAPAAAQPEPGGDGGGEPVIRETTTLHRDPGTPGTVTATIRYAVPETVETLSVTVRPAAKGWGTVRSAEGFDGRGNGEYEWTGADDPEITLTLSPGSDALGSAGRGVDAGDWAFLVTPHTGIRYQYGGADPAVERRYRVDGEGVATPGFTYLGPHRTLTDRRGETVRLVVPAAADPATPPAETLALLARASSRVDYGGRSGRVTGFVLPTDGVAGGRRLGTAVGDAFWVRADAPAGSPESAWVHEYLHTRENYSAAAKAGWFQEAVAEYYAAAVALDANRTTAPAVREHFSRVRDRDAVLTRRGTWDSPLVPYLTGQRVAAALDARVRNATGGTATLADVVRRLNRRGGRVTYARLRAAVAAVAGEPTAAWLDRYATTERVPPVPDGRPAALDAGA